MPDQDQNVRIDALLRLHVLGGDSVRKIKIVYESRLSVLQGSTADLQKIVTLLCTVRGPVVIGEFRPVRKYTASNCQLQ